MRQMDLTERPKRIIASITAKRQDKEEQRREMTHVKHLGFELELKVVKIVKALMWAPEEDRKIVIENLSPIGLKRAVADQFGIDL